VIEKIDMRDLDKSTSISIYFEPVLLVLTQHIYTYILRCSDLNFTYSDQLHDEFFFAKWKQAPIQADLSRFAGLVERTVFINIPALSLCLNNTDDSFLSELILQDCKY